MMRALALLLALSVTPATAQVLDPPPPFVGFDIEWRADLYAKDFVMRDVPLDSIAGRMDQPPFPTRRKCEANGYREAPRMVNFITAYMEADGSVRWECKRIGAGNPSR